MSKQKRIPAAQLDYPEDCLYCPNYRDERRGCKLKKFMGGERRKDKPSERRRKPWDG